MFVFLSFCMCKVEAGMEIKTPSISKDHQADVTAIKEQAKPLIEAHKKEVLSKVQEAKEIIQSVITEAKTNYNDSPCITQNQKENEGCSVIKSFKQDLSSKSSPVKASPQIVVCVSFSMPDESLKALFKEAEKNPNVRLVLQGLIDDSMEKTAQKIHEIEGVVDIDPEFFEKHKIERVPTFLWIKKDQSLAKLSGNITLSYAQEIFRTTLSAESSPS